MTFQRVCVGAFDIHAVIILSLHLFFYRSVNEKKFKMPQKSPFKSQKEQWDERRLQALSLCYDSRSDRRFIPTSNTEHQQRQIRDSVTYLLLFFFCLSECYSPLRFVITSLLFIVCCTLPISLHQDMTGELGIGNGMPQRGQVWD